MQKYKEYDPDELKHVQNLELKILKEIIENSKYIIKNPLEYRRYPWV